MFVAGDNKIRDHDHVTGKCRGSIYWSCNINLKLTKKVPVIFHNLRGYDSHLIMQEIDKFNFFSSLKDECISEKDYLHDIDVWNMFKINLMGDYHDFYLKADILLLADIF